MLLHLHVAWRDAYTAEDPEQHPTAPFSGSAYYSFFYCCSCFHADVCTVFTAEVLELPALRGWRPRSSFVIGFGFGLSCKGLSPLFGTC